MNDLSEKDIKVHKENTVKKPSKLAIPERLIDVLAKGINYKIATENIRVFDIMSGIGDAMKTLPTINTSAMDSILIVLTF